MSDNTSSKGMSDTFSNFRNFVSENPENHADLISMLKTPTPGNKGVIEYAEAQGFTLSNEDVEAYNMTMANGEAELNDIELATVAGGGKCSQ
jgi:hypothetical protein